MYIFPKLLGNSKSYILIKKTNLSDKSMLSRYRIQEVYAGYCGLMVLINKKV